VATLKWSQTGKWREDSCSCAESTTMSTCTAHIHSSRADGRQQWLPGEHGWVWNVPWSWPDHECTDGVKAMSKTRPSIFCDENNLDVAWQLQGWTGRHRSHMIRASGHSITQSFSEGWSCWSVTPDAWPRLTFKLKSNEATGHLLLQSVPRTTLAGFEAIRSAGRRSEERSSLPT